MHGGGLDEGEGVSSCRRQVCVSRVQAAEVYRSRHGSERFVFIFLFFNILILILILKMRLLCA